MDELPKPKPPRLLVVALIVLLSTGGCWETITNGVRKGNVIHDTLVQPDISKVGETGEGGHPSAQLAVTLLPPSHYRLGAPIPLTIRLANGHLRPAHYYMFNYLHPESRFLTWLNRDGRQVALTEHGKHVQQRETSSFEDFDGPFGDLGYEDFADFRVDMASLFRITQPGNYTVVV